MSSDRIIKIGMFGETRVGKTSLLRKYLDKDFKPGEPSTIAPSMKPIYFKREQKVYEIQFYDTRGQETHRELTKQYITGLNGIILVFDLTGMETFGKVKNWFDSIKENTDVEKTVICLVGNKLDLKEKKVVNSEEAKKIGESFGMTYMETSAFTGEKVDELYNFVIDNCIKNRFYIEREDRVELNKPKNKSKRCC